MSKKHAKAAAEANANLCLADGCIALLERMQQSANPRRLQTIERLLRALIQDELAVYDAEIKAVAGVPNAG